jgi:hypothetical protein
MKSKLVKKREAVIKRLSKYHGKSEDISCRAEPCIKNYMATLSLEKKITVSDIMRWVLIKFSDNVKSVSLEEITDDVNNFIRNNK